MTPPTPDATIAPDSRPANGPSVPPRQFIGFVAVGFASACLSLLTRYLANQILAFEWSVVVAHIAGMLFSFAVNRAFIFPKTDRPAPVELAKYTLVNLLSLAIATSVSSLFYRIILPAIGFDIATGLVAHFIGLGACAVPSFLGHKFFSFSAGKRAASPKAIDEGAV